MAEAGYLLIADISGYTAFLTQAELDHAHDILQGLMKKLLGALEPAMIVSKLEGDAVFCYAPEGRLAPDTLLELVERVYFDFSSARELMQLNTSCTCKACQLIPSLDLKFVVHKGSYIVSRIGAGDELTGPDVIVVHRLLKSEIKEATGITAYAFFSEASLPEGLREGMRPHRERYDHVGEVKGHVLDLKPGFARLRDSRRVVVEPQEAWIAVEAELPLPPARAWDLIVPPRCQAMIRQAREYKYLGRRGVGTQGHCFHGDTPNVDVVVDWRPLESYASEFHVPMGGVGLWSVQIAPSEHGTRVRWSMREPRTRSVIARPLLWLMCQLLRRLVIAPTFQKGSAQIAAAARALGSGDDVPVERARQAS
jgi:hypothetical protein